jgi:hypothetical protein
MRTWMMLAALAAGIGAVAEAKPPKVPNLPRDEPQVAVGDAVPELPLLYPDGTPVGIENFVHPGRPLVIVFGSFT